VDYSLCTHNEIEARRDQFIHQGYEGLIARNLNSTYQMKTRSVHLLKFKTFYDSEFQIVDFCEGNGSDKGAIIYVCLSSKNKRFKVRPMGTVEERRALFTDGESSLGKYLTVRYQTMNPKTGIPRITKGICVREDL
jgi:hypothetical protein